MKPTSAVLAVTYRCNSRCSTCDIWKREPGPELEPEDFRRLPEGLKNINISGGEPFLRDDLVDVVRVLREKYPRASIVISTNGLVPERTEQFVRRMGPVGVRVSVDAPDELNDLVRGVKGSFRLAMETVDRLAALGLRDLGISVTISAQSTGSLRRLKEIADEKGIEFVTGLVHSSPIYFGTHEDQTPSGRVLEAELLWLREKELSSRRVKDWFRAYFTDGILDQLQKRKRRIECGAARHFFFMEPGGDIYPCNMWPEKLGNIRLETYDEMLQRSGRLLRDVDSCEVECWMSCTVAPSMRRRPLGPAVWVLKHKLFRTAFRRQERAAGSRT